LNASELPLGHAPHVSGATEPEGTERLMCRYVNYEAAISTAAFLRLFGSGNSFAVTTDTPVLPAFEGKL
jgi:hypothetical protein